MKKNLLIVLLIIASFVSNAQFSQISNIYPANITEGDEFGSAVAIDGDFMAIGAYYYNDVSTAPGTGSVYMWHYDGTDWVYDSQIIPTNNPYNGDQFGNAVAISGSNMIVGAWNGSTDGDLNPGTVTFYHYDGSIWTDEIKFVCGINNYDLGYGTDVDILGDYAIVGAPGVDNNHGRAYIYFKNSGTWELQQNLVHASTNNDYFGSSVAIGNNIAFIGARGANEVYVYTYDGTNWSNTSILSPTTAGVSFGSSISYDGTNLIVGDEGDNSASIFSFDGTNWVEQKVTASDGSSTDHFGRSVSISGNYAIVGAWGKSSMTGASYIFENNNGTWSQSQKITASNGNSNDRFGNSVAIQNNTVVVGAYYDNSTGAESGSAYIFQGPPLPAPTITLQPQSDSVCIYSTSGFSIGSTDATSFQWQHNGVNIADTGYYSGSQTNMLSISNATHSYEGNYICIASNSNGSTSSEIAFLYVEDSVHASFNLTPRVTMFPNSNITFENLSDNDLSSYNWDFGDGTTTEDNEFIPNFSHYFDSWGIYFITLSIEGLACTDSFTDSVIIGMPAPLLVGSNVNDTTCGDNAEFFSNINYAEISQWYFNEQAILDTGLFSGVTTNHLIISNPTSLYQGGYYCIGTNDSGYVSTDTADLVIGEPVHAEFIATPQTTTFPNSNITIENISDTNLDYYYWDFGDDNNLLQTSYETNLQHYYDSIGTFEIALKVKNDICAAYDTSTIVILSPDFIANNITNISITPNPADNYIQIQGIKGESQIAIYSIDGKNITSENISEKQEIYIGNLQNGIYFVSIMGKDKTYFLKLVKD